MIGNCGECNRRWVCDIDPNECNLWPDPVPMTNADHIRAMSDEELANFLAPSFTCYACPSRILCDSDTTGRTCSEIFAEWLKQPYKEAPNDPT